MSYFEEYEDMFSEPSNVEQIIEDAKAALWNEHTANTSERGLKHGEADI